jgi:hypothetical protein
MISPVDVAAITKGRTSSCRRASRVGDTARRFVDGADVETGGCRATGGAARGADFDTNDRPVKKSNVPGAGPDGVDGDGNAGGGTAPPLPAATDAKSAP